MAPDTGVWCCQMGKSERFNASMYLDYKSCTDKEEPNPASTNIELKPIPLNVELFKSILAHVTNDLQKNVMMVVEGCQLYVPLTDKFRFVDIQNVTARVFYRETTRHLTESELEKYFATY